MFHTNNNKYTFKKYLDDMAELVALVEKNAVASTNSDDEKIAADMISFAHDLCKTGYNFDTAVFNKIDLGKELSRLPKKYFGDTKLPEIKGERTAYVARVLLIKQLESFQLIYFSDVEISMSKSVPASLKVLSIPQQRERAASQVVELTKRLEEYQKIAPVVKKVGW